MDDLDAELALEESIEMEMQMLREAETFDESEYPGYEEDEIEVQVEETKKVAVGETDSYRKANNLQNAVISSDVPKNVPVPIPAVPLQKRY